MTIDCPLYTCTRYEKKTETDYSPLLGMTKDMWGWYKAVGLIGWALENGVYNYTRKQKIELLEEKAGIYLQQEIDGPQTLL